MEFDDKLRSKVGVAVCLREMGNGETRLFMDDVIANSEENPINWKYKGFYTFTPELDLDKMIHFDLSKEEYANIGMALVTRLLAMNGHFK